MAASTSTAVKQTSNYYYYDVFINHRGPDAKRTFASHLYRRLLSHGLRAFLDQSELQPGDYFISQIEGAIQTASVHVAIFSPRYAESKWCLDELLLMFKSGSPILPVFYGVEPSELRWTRVNPKLSWARVKNGVYAQALHELEKKTTYDFQTQKEKPRYDSATIENWRDALSRVADISGLSLKAFNSDEGELLDKVVENVLKRVKKAPLNVAKYPTGLDEKVNDFETTVLMEQHIGKVQVVGITGLGGVGKTTLAKEIFNRKNSIYNKTCFLSDVRENAKTSIHSLQQKLLKGLIQLDLDIDNSHQGTEMLQKHLSSSQVLLVLDDVDHVDQVDALLPVHVLRPDSLILITSRDMDVLRRSGVQESNIYKLTGLNTQHSTELFCSHAFCQPHPISEFESLVESFVKACNGLPLSLKVFGALLYRNGDKSYWEDQLDKLQRILPSDIQKSLKISYDSLDRHEQQIFLDIASFFIGENRDTAIRIWDGSHWSGSLGFRTLQNKCLAEVDIENKIRMHDHLRDLGRDLVEASGLPRCVRLPTEDIDDWLQPSSEVAEVRGIRMLPSTEKDNGGNGEHASFPLPHLHMRKLQLLDAKDGFLERILRRVHSPNLLYLRWMNFPYSSLVTWIPMKHLRALEVQGKELKTLWEKESQAPLQLRELMINAPLSKFPESIGNMKYLERICFSLREENNVETLPEEFCNLQFLKDLVLTHCSKLKSLPDSFGRLTNLQQVNLSYCGTLERLPKSFGNLTRLKYLNLSHCSNLAISSETLGNISKLVYINLNFCKKIEVLPPQVASQLCMEELFLMGTNLKQLPSAIGELIDLEFLELGSPLLETLPPSLGELRNLKQLNLRDCKAMKCLPDSLRQLIQLGKLVLDCPIRQLPFRRVEGERDSLIESTGQRTCSNLGSSVDKCIFRLQHIRLYNTQISEVSFDEGLFPNLQHLHISFCHYLEKVATLPNALLELELIDCNNLKKIEGLGGLAKLRELMIKRCKVEELPSIDTLVSLHQLYLGDCVMLKSIQGLEQLTKLRLLYVNDCSELEKLPGVEQLSSLEELHAYGCVKLKSIRGLGKLTNLRILDVNDCSELQELEGVEYCMALECLTASRCPRLQWDDNIVEQLCQRVKQLDIW